ncbi:NUDIX hydrolase [Hymenobacter radiodurans]|uniref:NUDIX hydrolase n=1 Tax=Hymenobacter radiodurans TaxID=2496028 RepID=UPI001058B808|nr:NUDIX domain-containing protein [Hymenobacter radiodurans]
MTVAPGLKKAAVLCVLRHADAFLLLQRLKPPHQGLFTPVGGKLDPYESPQQAAFREVQEETGLQPLEMVWRGMLVETSPVDYNWISFVFEAHIERVPPPACSEGTLVWVEKAELAVVPTPLTDHFIYEYLLANRPFQFDATYDATLRPLVMREELQGLSLPLIS